MKYRKKPVVIEAVKWSGLNLEEVKEFAGSNLKYDICDTAWEVGKGAPVVTITIHTLEGDMVANKGDYIIKGVNNEFYPCKPEIFEKTYELVNSNLTYEIGRNLDDLNKQLFITKKGEFKNAWRLSGNRLVKGSLRIWYG